ncbi:MAG: hypothetical protein ACLU4N_09355 [Butyricimonas faecihominis]
MMMLTILPSIGGYEDRICTAGTSRLTNAERDIIQAKRDAYQEAIGN